MRKATIPKVSLKKISLFPFRKGEKENIAKLKGKFADNSTANEWWYRANSPTGPKIYLAAHVDEETKNFELYELSETPFFYKNDYLENIAATGNYGNVTDMREMFLDCDGLEMVDLSNFDSSNATSLNSMFAWCIKLKSIKFGSFDTSNVTTMRSMFQHCPNLLSVDMSNFDTSNATNINSMFKDCSALTTLNLSSFNTSKVEQMGSMFEECVSLTSLDLSNFDTSKTTDFSSMFYNCRALTTLNLSGFNANNVMYMNAMFGLCSSLTTVIGPVSGLKQNLDLHWSPLTTDSAMVFINGLATVASANTIKFKKSTYDSLTPEQIAVATSKGWTVVVDTGGHTGGVN